MRTIKEEQIGQLIKENKIKPVEVFKSGQAEKPHFEIDWEKRQAEAILSIRDLLQKVVQSNGDHEGKLISLFQKLTDQLDSGSGSKKEFKTSIDKLISTIEQYLKTLNKPATVPNQKPVKWTFDIHRDSQGRIESIEAVAGKE